MPDALTAYLAVGAVAAVALWCPGDGPAQAVFLMVFGPPILAGRVVAWVGDLFAGDDPDL